MNTNYQPLNDHIFKQGMDSLSKAFSISTNSYDVWKEILDKNGIDGEVFFNAVGHALKNHKKRSIVPAEFFEYIGKIKKSKWEKSDKVKSSGKVYTINCVDCKSIYDLYILDWQEKKKFKCRLCESYNILRKFKEIDPDDFETRFDPSEFESKSIIKDVIKYSGQYMGGRITKDQYSKHVAEWQMQYPSDRGQKLLNRIIQTEG